MKKISPARLETFRHTIRSYYRQHGRSLPWRQTTNPYHIFVSEVMLQQTQVPRVIQKYKEFIATFPHFESLAHAPLKQVLTVWQGLGYNRRAIALHRSAQLIMEQYHGILPTSIDTLDALPGIGYNTACSIAAFAFNAPVVFIETNIRAVFIHFFFAGKEAVTDSELLPLVAATLDHKHPREWYGALMDYGVYLKKTQVNPSRRSAHYAKQSPFLTSNRRIRGLIIKYMVQHAPLTLTELSRALDVEKSIIRDNVTKLTQEGFLTQKAHLFYIT
jgi:A/G-specific adenine glycosylase